MASGSQVRIPAMSQELQDLFSWCPPLLVPRLEKKLTVTTREPAFFDKHFTKRLVLKQVKHLPSLVEDIAQTVDDAMINASNNGITLPQLTVSASSFEETTVNRFDKMLDEKAVASYYDQTTAAFYLPVASTLALHPRASKWGSMISWTQSADSAFAIADGFLRVVLETESLNNPRLKAFRKELEDSMTEETRLVYHRLQSDLLKRFPAMATWEIKSLAVGRDDVMCAILNFKNGQFEWTPCQEPKCESLPNHKKAKARVRAVVGGPDAKTTPWRIGPAMDLGPQVGASGSSFPGTVTRPAKRKLGDEHSTLPLPSGSSRLLPSTSQPTRRSDRLKSSMPPPPLPVFSSAIKGKQKAENVEDDDKDQGSEDSAGDDDVNLKDDPSYKDKPELTAQDIVQQAWAQSVQNDSTIIVIHSGNHEVIGVRHRKTRTLYVSDVIVPSQCQPVAYGKLHTGIYIAAIQDTMDRAKQLIQSLDGDQDPSDGNQGPSDGDEGNDGSGSPPEGSSRGGRSNDGEGGRRGGRGEGGSGKRRKLSEAKSSGGTGEAQQRAANAKEMTTKEKTLELAYSLDVVLLYLQYGIYDSPVPSTFHRSAQPAVSSKQQVPTPPSSPQATRSFCLQDCLTIILTSEIGHGAIGTVLRGTMQAENSSGCGLVDVAVKLALKRWQQDALRQEYNIYRELQSNGVSTGTTTPFGLFDDAEGGPCILVMPYKGAPLLKKQELSVPISHRKAALAALKSIHRAGILHGDIRRSNILVAESGLTLIDFSHSRKCNDSVAKEKEYSYLQSLLLLAA